MSDLTQKDRITACEELLTAREHFPRNGLDGVMAPVDRACDRMEHAPRPWTTALTISAGVAKSSAKDDASRQG